MSSYYNEWDPYCARWLRNLIAAGHIPAGDVDERSIVDVRADELRGYRQCHFFAGIAGWPFALRLAGIPDDSEVWTGSCPCQPLSCAGQRKGDADDRHLWPAFYRLIAERRPSTVFGEQVSGKDGLEWLSAVRADLEGIGYAVGAADLPACGVGAPHIRRRLFWMAYAVSARRTEGRAIARDGSSTGRSDTSLLADSAGAGLEERQEQSARQERATVERSGDAGGSMEHSTREQVGLSGRAREQGSASGGMAHASSKPGQQVTGSTLGDEAPYGGTRRDGITPFGDHRHSSDGEGNPWSDLEWLPCIDGKWRPTKPGIQPLAYGVPGRVGKLRAAGNAIVPQVAAEFVKATMECIP